MIYKVKGTFYDEYDQEYQPHSYVIVADTNADVVEKLASYWGDDNIMSLTIDYCNDEDLIEIDPINNTVMVSEFDYTKED